MKVSHMYQSEIEQYFQSKDYLKHETDAHYIHLLEILSSSLNTELFLDCEELLHAIILEKIEFAFEAGYTIGSSYKKT